MGITMDPTFAFPSGLAPVSGFIVIVNAATAVWLGLLGATPISIGCVWTSLDAIHCSGARSVFQYFLVSDWWRG